MLVQLATPSRERVDSYQKLRKDIERQVGHINGEYAEVGHPVVHYLHRPVPRDELIAFFVASDVMLVTPLRDGMNLVAKEYVACRSDLGGALVLSEFTGAAAELRQAYLVNPHDLEGVKDAIEAALNQTDDEGRRRMRALRRQVLAHDVDRWARSFLDALADWRIRRTAESVVRPVAARCDTRCTCGKPEGSMKVITSRGLTAAAVMTLVAVGTSIPGQSARPATGRHVQLHRSGRARDDLEDLGSVRCAIPHSAPSLISPTPSSPPTLRTERREHHARADQPLGEDGELQSAGPD